MNSIEQIEKLTAEIDARLAEVRGADTKASKDAALRDLLCRVEDALRLASEAGLTLEVHQVTVQRMNSPFSEDRWQVRASRTEFVN